MLGTLARLLINHSADDGRVLPKWVRKRLQRDSALAAYDRQCRDLVSKLREDAPDWAQSAQSVAAASDFNRQIKWPTERVQTTLEPFVQQRLRATASSLRMAGILALTAVVLIAVFTVWSATRPPGVRGQQLVKSIGHEQQAEIDLQPVVASWAAGEEVARKVSTGARKFWTKTANHPALVSISGQAALASSSLASSTLASSAGGRIRQVRQELSSGVRRIVAALAEMDAADASKSTVSAH